jgi:hypothetical protein
MMLRMADTATAATPATPATSAAARTRSDLGPGDPAPDFELPGTSEQAGVHREKPKRRYRLSDYRDQHVLLVFFSAAFTPT